MPNHLQLLFLASFFLTFIILLTLSNLLSSKLRDAGYDISDLILIGLPKSEHSHPNSPNQMATSAPSFLDVRQSAVAQLIVLLLAAVSSTFMYLKFGRTGTSSFPTWLSTPSYTP
jgi:cytochrome-b5 reductase